MTDSPVPRIGAWAIAAVLAFVATMTLVAVALAVMAAWLCIRHPFLVAILTLSLGAAVTVGGPATLCMWALVLGGGLGVRSRWRATFDRWVLRHWRRTSVYGWRWRWAMKTCDLDAATRHGIRRVPRLGTVWSSRWLDTLTVHPLVGQNAAVFSARADELARLFGVLSCEVREDPSGVVRLLLRRGDPLQHPVAPLPIQERPDVTSLRIGRREDGAPWTISLTDGHILVVGAPGAGTRSVVWSLLRALAIPVHQGTIEVWGVDGTGGIALGPGAEMFTHLTLGGPEEGAALLRAATARLQHRPGAVRQYPSGARTISSPLVLLVLHELVRWGSMVDEPLRTRLVPTLDLLIDYGQTGGIVIVATAPIAHAELASRFPQRVMLGNAHARRFDPSEVGSAVTQRQGAVRVRVSHMGDADISTTAATFPAPSHREDDTMGDSDHPFRLDV